MIIVAEGLSASGKTTWCNRFFPDQTVWEAPIPDNAPSRQTQPKLASRFWVKQNAKRWSEAKAIEADHGLAVCDTDPFKLHYAYSLWKLGELSLDQREFELALHRDLFASGELGLADLNLVSLPDLQTLRAQKDGDKSRTRRSFELHVKLGPHLERWYSTIERLEPERVVWNFPEVDVNSHFKDFVPRTERSSVEQFDQLVAELHR